MTLDVPPTPQASPTAADDIFSDPSSLCRVGKYREAAQLCLRQFRESRQANAIQAFSLAKAGRHKLAILFCLDIIKERGDASAQCIAILSESVKNYKPCIDEIDKANDLIAKVRLAPAMLALIGSQINESRVCDHFFESYIIRHGLSDAEIRLAEAYTAKIHGDTVRALSIAQELATSDVFAIQASSLAAEILLGNDYTYEAQRYACHALKQEPSNIHILEILGLCLYKRARWRAARRIFKKIHDLTQDDISLLNSLITLPLIALSRTDLPQAVQGFKRLDKLLQNSPQLLGIVESLERCKAPLPSEFYLAYEGPVSIRRNLELARNFQRLSAHKIIQEIKTVYGKPGGDQAESTTRETLSGKIRIGFISRFFSYHSNLVAHYGLIKHLNRNEFEVIVIHRSNAVKDSYHAEVNGMADKVVYLKDELGECCGQISGLCLDILFFTDLGMNPFDCILAMPHLARYQVTSWGLPHTTGVKEIDFHLRSSIFSDCEGQDEYTEKLVSIKGYIGYFSHAHIKPSNTCRDYFLLPPDRFLVGCLQSLHKIHPDFDDYLEEIAKIDESILIIISPSEHDHLMRDFMARIKKAAPTAYQQLCVVQRTSIEDFLGLNIILDLNLDTIYYGAGISFIQTAWCGPPYITQHSNLVRASAVARSYAYAGIEKPPIAKDKQEYIDLVRHYFTHRNELAQLRKEIRTKAEGTIYDSRDYIEGYEEFFKQICTGQPVHTFSPSH